MTVCCGGDRCKDPESPLRPGRKCTVCQQYVHDQCISYDDPNYTTCPNCQPPFVVNGVDVTKVHPSVRSIARVPTSNKKSLWWKFYHEGVVDGKRIAFCNFCGVKLAIHGGTTTLSRHIQSCSLCDDAIIAQVEQQELERQNMVAKLPPPPPKSSKKKRTASVHRTSLSVSTSSNNPNKRSKTEERKTVEERCLDSYVMYLAETNHPFSDIDNRAFEEMIESIVTSAKAKGRYLFSKNAVKDRMIALAEDARGRLKEMLDDKILIATTHHWKSRADDFYASLNIHWINDFKVKQSCLAVCIGKGEIIGNNLVSLFAEEMRQWKISADVIPYIVTDTEVETESYHAALKEYSCAQHIYCLDYLLDLVAKVAMEAYVGQDVGSNGKGTDQPAALAEPENSNGGSKSRIVEKARIIVDFLANSSQELEKLREKRSADNNKSPLPELAKDIIPRWWSTMDTLDFVLEMKEELTDCGVEPLNEDEWNTLNELNIILQPLRFAQKLLKGYTTVTSSSVVFISASVRNKLTVLTKSDKYSPKLQEVAKKMVTELDRLFGFDFSIPFERNQQGGIHKALLFAHALDPRFKSLGAHWHSSNKTTLWESLLHEMVCLEPPDATSKDIASAETNVNMKTEPTDLEEEYAAMYAEADEHASKEKDNDTETWRRFCEAELSAYQSEKPVRLTECNDPLDWWKVHHQLYPTLWRLCQKYLAIPAIAAAPSRAFSSTGNMITKQRCQLAGSTTDDFHFLHENRWILHPGEVQIVESSIQPTAQAKVKKEEHPVVVSV